jgi:hypothetical protein
MNPDPVPDPTPDPTPFFSDFKDAKKISYFFSYNLPVGTHLLSFKFNLLKFCFQILCCKHYFCSLNTFIRKGKDPDPYLGLIDPDPGGPKHAGSSTLFERHAAE